MPKPFHLAETPVNHRVVLNRNPDLAPSRLPSTVRVAVAPALVVFFAVVGLLNGCAWDIDTTRKLASLTSFNSTGVEVRRRPRNRLEAPMSWWANMTGYGGIQPAERTQLYLRTNALEEAFRENPKDVLINLRKQADQDPDLERLHVLADLAYVEGHQHRMAGDEKYAGQMLATAVSASYEYLFDPRLDHRRNAYDPVFRKACDLYNQSLEGLLRIMKEQDALRPGGHFTATTLDNRPLQVQIGVSGRWANEDFLKFEFVSDFNTQGLRNVHHTYGLGVPLIAIRKSSDSRRPDEQYYPADLSMPLTAFVRTSVETPQPDDQQSFDVQLVDPLEKTEVRIADRFAPLESDITTPLAYYLDDPLLDANWFATAALLRGDFARQFGGLYMLEPYDPTKIPVVMVHGFWSSPMTWTEMFNDLRADKSIRDNYQFWFYLYPSGQPFWFSARQMRQDLTEVRQALDPNDSSRALNEMVLVGHSMGGLVSRLQTIDSGEQFWNLVSERDINQLKGEPETRQRVRDTLYFSANPSVARVITLGTPHRGSQVSNSFTQWASQKLFTLPSNLTSEYSQLMNNNPDFFKSDMLKITTSTDSLSPDSKFFEVLMQARPNPQVRFHNIIGLYDNSGPVGLLGGTKEPSDGVVTVASAKCPDATSEIEIAAEHSSVHQHPRAVLEVRRILSEHLQEVFSRGYTDSQIRKHGNGAEARMENAADRRSYNVMPATYDQEVRDPRNPK